MDAMAELDYEQQASTLWEESWVDWHVSLTLVLTEPVCAIVDLHSDDETLPRLEGFIGTADANESIRLACDYMLRNLRTFYADNPDRKPQR